MTGRWRALRGLPAADLLPGLGLLAGLVLGLVASGLTPVLLASHVVLLEALSGGVLSLVVGGAQARVGASPLLAVVLAPLAGVLLYDVAYWAAGRRWGTLLLDRLARRRRGPRAQSGDGSHPVLALVQRRGVVALAVTYYQPVPNPLVYAACGASGMSLATFLLGDAVGTLLWVALLVSLGWTFGRQGVATVHALSDHTLLATVVVVGVVLLVRGVRARGRWGRGGVRSAGRQGDGVDDDLHQRIEALVAEQHDLRAAHQAGSGPDEQEQARLREIEQALDRTWDLLRQRQARRDAGQDPDGAHERRTGVVEDYLS